MICSIPAKSLSLSKNQAVFLLVKYSLLIILLYNTPNIFSSNSVPRFTILNFVRNLKIIYEGELKNHLNFLEKKCPLRQNYLSVQEIVVILFFSIISPHEFHANWIKAAVHSFLSTCLKFL